MLTILSDEKQGLKSLEVDCLKEYKYRVVRCLNISLTVKEYTTPMRMLIEHMPGT